MLFSIKSWKRKSPFEFWKFLEHPINEQQTTSFFICGKLSRPVSLNCCWSKICMFGKIWNRYKKSLSSLLISLPYANMLPYKFPIFLIIWYARCSLPFSLSLSCQHTDMQIDREALIPSDRRTQTILERLPRLSALNTITDFGEDPLSSTYKVQF